MVHAHTACGILSTSVYFFLVSGAAPQVATAGSILVPPSQSAFFLVCATTNGICPPTNTVTPTGVDVSIGTYTPPTASYSNSWDIANNQLSVAVTGTISSPTLLSAASSSIWITNPADVLAGYAVVWAGDEDNLTVNAPGLAGQTGFISFAIALDMKYIVFGAGQPDAELGLFVYPDGPGVTYPEGGGWQFYCGVDLSQPCGQYTVTTPIFGFTFGETFNLEFQVFARTGSPSGNTAGSSSITADLARVNVLDAMAQPVMDASINSAFGGNYLPQPVPEPWSVSLVGVPLIALLALGTRARLSS